MPRSRGWGPVSRSREDRPTPRSPGGASIDRSSAMGLPIRAFSAADRACDIASDVLLPAAPCEPDRDCSWPSPITWNCLIRLHRRLVKGRRLHRIRTPSIAEHAGQAEALPAMSRFRCSRARGLRHCEPAPAPLHPASLPGGRADGLDPRAREGGGPSAARRLLQSKQPASTTTRSTDPHDAEHSRACAFALHPSRGLSPSRTGGSTRPPACARNPACVSVRRWRAPGIEASASWPADPPKRVCWGRGLRLELARGWLPLRLSTRGASTERRPGSCDPERSCLTDACAPALHGESAASANRGFTGQGQVAFAAGASRRGLPGGRRWQELRPNPIRSDTSCRGFTAPPEGDSGLACDPTEGRITRASAKKQWDPPHPRCLPSMSRLARGSSAEASLRVPRVRPDRTDSHRGSGVIHSLSPSCGEHRCLHGVPALSALPHGPLPLTGQRRRGAGRVSGRGMTSTGCHFRGDHLRGCADWTSF